MCGIIALISRKNEVVDNIAISLSSLQHRGQDASGIVTSSKDKVFIKKEMDSVHRVFTPDVREELKGKMGVGHTRYATQGKGTLDDAQPIVTKNIPHIALALNGNTINYFDLNVI